MITCVNRQLVMDFFESKLEVHPTADFRGVLFIPDKFKGLPMEMDHVGVAFAWNGFVGKICHISIIVQKPECLTRKVGYEAFRFPFKVCKCEAVVAHVDSNNLKSIDMCQRVGFKLIHTVKNAGRTGDLLQFEMLRSEFLSRSARYENVV